MLAEFRRPLLVALVLVVLDAPGLPGRPRAGQRRASTTAWRTAPSACCSRASGIFLLVTLADLVDEIGETFVTGQAAQRIMLSLRIRIWAQLQRLSLDYYEREMAGRIMTRMTTDVDQFESLIENGVLSALVAVVTFVGVGVALVVINPELGLCTLCVVVPLAVATVVFRRRAARLYDLSRERIGIVNADFQESLSGVRESQAFVHETATRRASTSWAATTWSPASRPNAWSPPTSPSCSSSPAVADAIVLGVGAGLDRRGPPDLRRPDRLHPVHRPVLLAHPAALPGLRLLAADPGFGAVGSPSSCNSRPAPPRPPAPSTPADLEGGLRLDDVRFAYPLAASRPAPGGPAVGASGPG